MRASVGKNGAKNCEKGPVVTRFVVGIIVGILVISEFANAKAEECTKYVNSAATAIFVESANQIARAQPAIDHIGKDLREHGPKCTQAHTFNKSST